MSPTTFFDGRIALHRGDCLEVMAAMPSDSVDAVCCDPPYHLTSIVDRFGKEGAAPAQHGTDGAFARASRGFMGKEWDGGDIAFRVETWAHVLRILKPGGHLVAFSGTRTYHRMAVAIEDAGFEIRDQLAWVYGSGFPKSHNVAKAMQRRRVEDEAPTRAVCRAIRAAMDAKGLKSKDLVEHFDDCHPRLIDHWAARDTDSQPSMPTVAQWEVLVEVLDCAELRGHEPAVHALNERKGEAGDAWKEAVITGEHEDPAGVSRWREKYTGNGSARDRTIREATADAAEWEGWGTALKPAWEPIVLARKPLIGTVVENVLEHGTGALHVAACRVGTEERTAAYSSLKAAHNSSFGKPEAREARRGLPLTQATYEGRYPANIVHDGSPEVVAAFPAVAGAGGAASGPTLRGENTSVARGKFAGLADGVSPAFHADSGSAARFFYSAKADGDDRHGSNHPTVKPVDLMRWLVRLVCRKGGTVLDPFAGTGTTGEGAFWEGCNAILIEREPEYQADIVKRMGLVLGGPDEKKRARTKLDPPEGLPLFAPTVDNSTTKVA